MYTPIPTKMPGVTPQLKVRTDLQGGASMESCQNNITYWQKEFTNKYNQSVANGYKPPFPNPLPPT